MMGPIERNGDSVACYVDGILACYAELSGLSDLKPSSCVNHAFEKLVALCSETPDESVVAKARAIPTFHFCPQRLRGADIVGSKDCCDNPSLAAAMLGR